MDLVQIENTVPPWHQSTEQLTACPVMYVEVAIKNHPKPGGMESVRGQQVHVVGAKYVTHCALARVASDLKAFDEFAAGAGPVAARILAGMRDSFEVDYEHFLAAELTLSLDENFQPTHVPDVIAQMSSTSSGKPPAYVGTLDAVYSYLQQAMMKIIDLKTHPRPFSPDDTLQAKTYALFLFRHFAWVQKIYFELVFVRYRNVRRVVEFTRDMVPELMEAVGAARQRQLKIHEDYEAGRELKAIGNDSCFYCPLLHSRDCPILQDNPNAHGNPSEWLSSALVYSAYAKVNNARMRALVQSSGKNIVLRDYNGKAYTFGPEEKQSEVYPVFQFDGDGNMVMRRKTIPLLPIIDLLYDYYHDNPGDGDWMRNLVISSSSLRKYLKTNKRSFLDQAVEDTADKVTKVKMVVSKPLDAVPEEESDGEGWEDEEEFF